MPPAVIAAGITAVGTGVGTAINANAQNRAARGQQKATAGAMRMQQATENRQWDAYNAAVQRRTALQDALLGRYGITLPHAGGAPAAPAPSLMPQQPGPAVAAPQAGAAALPSGPPQGDVTGQPAQPLIPRGYGLVGPPPEPGTVKPPAPATGWNQWRGL